MFLHKTLESLLFNKKIGLMRSTDMRLILWEFLLLGEILKFLTCIKMTKLENEIT